MQRRGAFRVPAPAMRGGPLTTCTCSTPGRRALRLRARTCCAPRARVCAAPPCSQIGAFLKAVKEQLVTDFRELRHVSVDNLMYIKEDIILPHHHTFYDLIVNKVTWEWRSRRVWCLHARKPARSAAQHVLAACACVRAGARQVGAAVRLWRARGHSAGERRQPGEERVARGKGGGAALVRPQQAHLPRQPLGGEGPQGACVCGRSALSAAGCAVDPAHPRRCALPPRPRAPAQIYDPEKKYDTYTIYGD